MLANPESSGTPGREYISPAIESAFLMYEWAESKLTPPMLRDTLAVSIRQLADMHLKRGIDKEAWTAVAGMSHELGATEESERNYGYLHPQFDEHQKDPEYLFAVEKGSS